MLHDTPVRGWLGDDVESRVIEIGEKYLDRLQAGERPGREALMEAHPDIREELERHLKLVELLWHGRRAMLGGNPPA